MGDLDDNFKGRSQRLAYELGVALSLMTPIQKKLFNRTIFVERSRRGNARARLQTQKKFLGYDPTKNITPAA